MSISSDITITRQKALETVYQQILNEQQELIKLAVNGMSNDDLARKLNYDNDLYYYNVEGKGKLK